MDRAEWDAMLAQRKSEKGKKDKPKIALVRQAAVSAEKLTGDEAWDRFLSYLQAEWEKSSEQIAVWTAKLSDPTVVNPDEMMAVKIEILIWTSRAKALSEVMDLPKILKEEGAKADELLEG